MLLEACQGKGEMREQLVDWWVKCPYTGEHILIFYVPEIWLHFKQFIIYFKILEGSQHIEIAKILSP